MHCGTYWSSDLIVNPAVVLPQVRVKILGKLSEDTKGPLMKLHICLSGKVSRLSVGSAAGSNAVTGSCSLSVLRRPSKTF